MELETSERDARAEAADTLAALAWQLEAGANEVISPTPQDRRLEAQASPTAPAKSAPAATAPSATATPATATASPPKSASAKRTPAAAPPSAPTPDLSGLKDLESLWDAIKAFDGCGLKAGARNTVIWRGNASARLAIVGEAPGADEDARGEPFVGRSGRLLDEMLRWAGLDSERVFITNSVFWRPPNNRKPTPEETAACLPFCIRQFELLKPACVLVLGSSAVEALLPQAASEGGITRIRGRWTTLTLSPGHAPIPALPSFHPSYGLRQPAQKSFIWRDILAAVEKWESLTDLRADARPRPRA